MSELAFREDRKPRIWTRVGFDRVVLASVAILLVLAVLVPEQALASVVFVADAFFGILPFLLVSIAFAAGARASGLDQPIAAVFSKNQTTAIVLAALLGSLSPFCSCGVIPIITGLLQAGVPLAPVMAFWVASPLMDPEMFLLLVGGIGLQFTLAKLVAATAIGLAAGFAVYGLRHLPGIGSPLKAGLSTCGSGCGAKTPESPVHWTFWRDRDRMAVFTRSAGETGWFLGKWLALAFLIESLMVAYVPAELVTEWLGGSEWWVVPMASGVGIPAYLNGYAAIPLVRGLLDAGMLPGAGLAFMIAGGVTSIPAAMAVYVAVNRTVFSVYLVLGIAGAIASGIAYQAYLGL